MRSALYAFLFSLCAMPLPASAAATVTVAWDKNLENDVIGYKMHYGTTSGNYQYSVDVGNNTSCSISGLNEGTTHYFAATAYDSENNESDFSEELSHSIPIPPPDLDTDSSIMQLAATPLEGVQATVGNETVFAFTSTSNKRRAMPFTMPEDGTIDSITIYHEGGSGNVILAVYDGQTLPDFQLAVTAQTVVEASAGWQTVGLNTPVFVPGGTRIWLAWVFENNPGIRYEFGSPGRAKSNQSWSGGIPDPFGASSQKNYVYSIYATSSPDGTP